MISANRSFVMLMPYFGPLPEWIDLYLESCRWNDRFHFVIFSDDENRPSNPPPNVRFVRMSLEDLNRLYLESFSTRQPLRTPYKICDLRPAFGQIFASYIADYEYFGWGDLDVVYGGLQDYLSEEMLQADVISFNRDHVSGHLTIVRTACAETLTSAFPRWFELVDHPENQRLDEPKHLDALRLCAIESFNTPLSPLKPWTDGRFVFPKEWYWRKGRLTNDLDGEREFPYLHFMHWKGGAWPRQCGNAQWEKLQRLVHVPPDERSRGFCVNERGFFPLPDPIRLDGQVG